MLDRLVRRWKRVTGPSTVEIAVTELAVIWLPHNRPAWASASPAAQPPTGAINGPVAPASTVTAVEPKPDAARAATGRSAAPGELSVGERAGAPRAASPQPAGSVPSAPAASASLATSMAADDAAAGIGAGLAMSPGLTPWPEPFRSLLAPYVARAQAQGVWSAWDAAIRALVEHGETPSLVQERGSADREARDLYAVRESLGRVSLREHTAHVLEAMLELLREQFRDPASQAPRAVLAALAHDLGKVPAWRQVKAYGKQDHAAISALKVREWVGAGEPPWWLESVAGAIRDHHRRSTDWLTQLLQRADLRAREREVAAMTGALSVQAFPAWMDDARWRELVAQEIDFLQRGNQWVAFTWRGVVYAKRELLLRAARTVLRERQAVDLVFLAESFEEQAAARLVQWCRRQGWLAGEIGDGYSGLPYDIELALPHRPPTVLPPHYLIPLRVEAFGEEGMFRARKAGVLALVTAVRERPIKAAMAEIV